MSSVVISGDTSGTVSLTVPAVAGTNTATLPAATGTVMVSGNMPAFSAYQSSAQSITGGVATKVQFQTKTFDTASAFNNTGSTVGTAPAYSFNPQVAGYYQISGCVGTSGTSGEVAVYVFKNGAVYQTGTNVVATNIYRSVYASLVYLNGSTDYVEIYLYQASTANLNANSYATYFNGVMMRAA